MKILIVDDEKTVRKTLGDYLRKAGHEVAEACDGEEGLRALQAAGYDIALLDVLMPGMDGLSLLKKGREVQPEALYVMITGHANVESAVLALRSGATDFLQKPVKFLELDAVLERSAQIRGLRQENRRLSDTIGGMQAAEELRTRGRRFVGTSPAMQRVRKQIRQAVEASCDTILITGETGTGKEVAARSIHFHAFSDEHPFIAISCPALPDTLVESELFGHVRGAFTGATEDRAGYFELADGGTLFLDEIGDLSKAAQAKLLRLIETRTLRRVGGGEEKTVDVRVIAATNVSLETLVEAGKFRRDLLYRLNLYAIDISPLRTRREDILPLARHFLDVYARQRELHFDGFAEDAERFLLGYNYPGNARELRNMVERAAILCSSGMLQLAHLAPPVPDIAVPEPKPENSDDDPERARVLTALEDAKWNRREAAQLLGISYSALRHRIRKFGIG